MPIGSREVTLDVTPNREILCECWVHADWRQRAQIGLLNKEPEVKFNGEGSAEDKALVVIAEKGKNRFMSDASGKIRVIIENQMRDATPVIPSTSWKEEHEPHDRFLLGPSVSRKEQEVANNPPWRGSNIRANLVADSTVRGTRYWYIESEDGGGKGPNDPEANDCVLKLTWTK